MHNFHVSTSTGPHHYLYTEAMLEHNGWMLFLHATADGLFRSLSSSSAETAAAFRYEGPAFPWAPFPVLLLFTGADSECRNSNLLV